MRNSVVGRGRAVARNRVVSAKFASERGKHQMIRGNRIGAVIAVLSCALVAPAVMAAPIAPGNGPQTIDIAGTRMTVFTYRPPNCSDPSLLLVFHGVARNARTY